jgi:hypothetical protein
LTSKQAPASPKRSDANRFTIVSVRTEDELLRHKVAWDDLARDALEPNVFYESWFLLPAVRAFGDGQSLLFLFVYEQQPKKRDQAPVLSGFFPLVEERGYKGLPVRRLALWQHAYSVLGAPLLRRESARDVLSAFLAWAGRGPHGCGLVHLPLFPGHGPLYQALVEDSHRHARVSHLDEAHTRALLLPRTDAATYRALALGTHHNKKLRWKERSLARIGHLEYRTVDRADDVTAWAEEFLRLEAAGWKGREGTALACHDADRVFFRTILAAAWARGRLMMLGLFLDGRPAALKCKFRAGEGSFAFKVAYDETLAKYSPGVLLELYNIEHLHRNPQTRWMDSCAVAGHPMLDGLWLDRRVIVDIVLSTGQRPGDLVVSMLPALRWLKRKISFRGCAPSTEAGA